MGQAWERGRVREQGSGIDQIDGRRRRMIKGGVGGANAMGKVERWGQCKEAL